MWQHSKRAVGPAVAFQFSAFLWERSYPNCCSAQLIRGMPERAIYPHPRFLMSVTEAILSLSAIFDSLKQQAESNLTTLVKSSASHGHEEAMLWDEPVSGSESESESEENAITTAAVTEGWAAGLEPIQVEGVTLPAATTLTVNDKKNIDLYRNGHGVRTVRAPFGINLHVYVATLYTQQPIRSDKDIEELWDNDGFVMEFTFLREVSPSQMSIAWNYQLDTSVTESNYENYSSDREAFLKLLDGDMAKGGIIRFDFQPDRLILSNQGQLVGEIKGVNFQKAFASMWFGSRPVMEEIKAGLLQGGDVAGLARK